MDIALYCLAAAIIGFLLAWLIKKSGTAGIKALEAQANTLQTSIATLQAEKGALAAENNRLSTSLKEATIELDSTKTQATVQATRLEAQKEAITALRAEITTITTAREQAEREAAQNDREAHRLKTELQFKDQQLATQQKQLEDIGHQFTREFQVLAQKILDEKTQTFNSLQEKSLGDLLNPLRENLLAFKTEFEGKYTKESEERISLREQIKYMMDLNQTLSTQANNLTNALRGQVKQQGNWGEMILESILEYADLKKDVHFFVQERSSGDEGQTLLPDVVVRYPGQHSIVIDSKVSLLHYEQYCNAGTGDEQEVALSLLLQSTKRHIEGLSSKKYQDSVGALDAVMMFIPVEGAYITLMQAEPQLWQYAYKKRVLLISPTNLIAAMKLVYDLWKREGINQNAKEIAERAVKIYEKLASFIEDFEKVGTQLEKTGTAFKEARKRLHTGRGNVISMAGQMKTQLGHNKPNRELPPGLIEEAQAEEERED